MFVRQFGNICYYNIFKLQLSAKKKKNNIYNMNSVSLFKTYFNCIFFKYRYKYKYKYKYR